MSQLRGARRYLSRFVRPTKTISLLTEPPSPYRPSDWGLSVYWC